MPYSIALMLYCAKLNAKCINYICPSLCIISQTFKGFREHLIHKRRKPLLSIASLGYQNLYCKRKHYNMISPETQYCYYYEYCLWSLSEVTRFWLETQCSVPARALKVFLHHFEKNCTWSSPDSCVMGTRALSLGKNRSERNADINLHLMLR